MQAGDLARHPAAARQRRAECGIGVAQLPERGTDAGLGAGVLPHRRQRPARLGQDPADRQRFQHCGQRLASLPFQHSRAQQFRQDGQRHEAHVGKSGAAQRLAQGQTRVTRGRHHGDGSQDIIPLLVPDNVPQSFGQPWRQPLDDQAMFIRGVRSMHGLTVAVPR